MNDCRFDAAIKWGLLANGSSGPWSVEIDEASDGTAFNMQIDGPSFYVAFELDELPLLQTLLSFLRERTKSGGAKLRLGRCGSMEVSFLQDDECATRWFLIMAEKPGVAVRLSVDAEDVEALQQVVEDLPQ
jgi:hypothetical protein